jgi:hypothetical protein
MSKGGAEPIISFELDEVRFHTGNLDARNDTAVLIGSLEAALFMGARLPGTDQLLLNTYTTSKERGNRLQNTAS